MKDDQSNKLKSYNATLNYLDANKTVWNTIGIVGNLKNKLSVLVMDIGESAEAQLGAKVYLGKDTKALKRDLSDLMDILDDGLESYAEVTNDQQLKAYSTNTMTDYFSLPMEGFKVKVKKVIALLEQYLDKLGEYAITQEQIEEAKILFDAFLESQGSTREYRAASKAATTQLGEHFEAAEAAITQLDKIMKRFRRSNKPFYEGYLSVRKMY